MSWPPHIKSNPIDIRSAKIWIEEPDILWFEEKKGIHINLSDAIETIEIAKNLAGERKFLILGDIRNILSMTKEAKDFFSQKNNTSFMRCIAIIVKSSGSKIAANLYLKVVKQDFPIRLFSSVEDAVMWLRSHNQETITRRKTSHIIENEYFIMHYQESINRVYFRYHDNTYMTIQVAKLVEESMARFCNFGKVTACIDISGVNGFTKEAQAIISKIKDRYVLKAAIITKYPLSRIIANTFIRFLTNSTQMKLFKNKKNALFWLNHELIEEVELKDQNYDFKKFKMLIDQLVEYSHGDFSIKYEPSESGDRLDELGLAINMLGEELLTKEEKLADTHVQLIQSGKLAALGEMSAGVAHEINNPLCFIKGFNVCIGDIINNNENLSSFHIEEIKEFVNLIDQNVNRITKIVQHFRDFSRQAQCNFEAIDIYKVIKDSFILLDKQFQLCCIEIKLNLEENQAIILGNANQLEQIFVNLLRNAKDAIIEAHGNLGGFITISSQFIDGTVLIELSDNGVGIPEINISKIFNPFFTTKDIGKGTGLGLSLSHGIIEDHKGQITCHSVLGTGSTFKIKFPLFQINSENQESA